MPGFIKLDTITKELKFSPLPLDTKDEFKILLDLQDSFGAISSYKFAVQLKSTNTKKEKAASVIRMDIERVTRDS